MFRPIKAGALLAAAAVVPRPTNVTSVQDEIAQLLHANADAHRDSSEHTVLNVCEELFQLIQSTVEPTQTPSPTPVPQLVPGSVVPPIPEPGDVNPASVSTETTETEVDASNESDTQSDVDSTLPQADEAI